MRAISYSTEKGHTMLTQNLSEFWENMYSDGKDYWDLKGPTPALKEFFNHASCPKEGNVLVVAAGRGHDAAAWAERGHEVVAVDYCPSAVDSLDSLQRKIKNLKALDLDLFELSPKDAKKCGQTFDIVYDYGCFTAIHPGRRDELIEVWYKMLKPDGIIIAFFYPLTSGNTMAGPPHCTTEGELMARLDGIFDVVERIVPNESVKGRVGKEQIWILKKVEG